MTDHIAPAVAPGYRIWFSEERRAYTVQAVSADGRWAVCTKPFSAQRTVLYTVVDFEANQRGVDNYGGLGYETAEQCRDALIRFEQGDARFSRRRPPIALKIDKIEPL